MTPLIRAETLAFAYPQESRGMGPVTLKIEAGDAVLLHGPSGCGKSTLARCLTGLIPHLYHGKMSGSVWLGELRTDQAPLWQLSEVAGLVFQNPAAQMLASSVEEELVFGLENLGLPAAEIYHRVDEAVSLFGLEAFCKRSPHTLSGGEQQKLALAAIVARRPPALVLDEPLSMLDTTAALDFVELLAARRTEGTALVVCEHRREYIETLPGLRCLALNHSDVSQESTPIVYEPATPDLDCRLEARQLNVARGERRVLQDLDLVLRGGEVTAIVGRNGVGKTTLLRALAGLQSYEGEILAQVAGKTEVAQLAIVFQNPDLQLFNASVRQEILYRLPDPDPVLYSQLVQMLGLEGYEHTPPLLLSEGEKRRVALGMALIRRPRHGLLLDEPALGQDPAHKAQLARILRQIASDGRVVAFATHDIELACQADRLILLGPQGIAASGEPQQVLQMQTIWDQLGLRLPAWITGQPDYSERVPHAS